MPVDPTSLSVPAFGAAFWQPYVPIARPDHAATAGDTGSAPGLSYSVPLHGSHADFLASEDFKRYEQEVRDRLSFLVDFCRRHGVPDAQQIEDNFGTFLDHRFADHHYFDTRAEIVDSIGKQSLDEFCFMVRNDAIETDARTAAIRNLSYGVTLCADGAISNLVSAACMLAKAVGGIRGTLWKLKEETASNVLRHLTDQRFGRAETYVGNEIHYVNTAWNLIADQFGLEKSPDGITFPEVVRDDQFLASCTAEVSRALTPDRLALLIAEDCQARFHSRMALARLPPTGLWDPSIEKRVSEALEEIGDELGLTSPEEVQLAAYAEAAPLRESDLRIVSFLDIEQDHGIEEEQNELCAYIYTVRPGPALIALDVLRAMDGLKLLRALDGPRKSAEWVDEDNVRVAVFVYGSLTWVVRGVSEGSVLDPVWNSRDAQFSPLTLPDLLAWETVRAQPGQAPAAAAIRQAIEATTAEQLTQMPARWLEEADNLRGLLRRLGPNQAAAYLAKNLSLLGAIGAGFTNPEREAVLDDILRMGNGKAMRGLCEQWATNPLACGDMIFRVLLREAVPGLHKAMLQEEPKAAVQAWYRPLREAGLLTLVAPHAAHLLKARYSSASIFSEVLSDGRAPAVAAFLDLVKELLKDAALRWHMKDELAGLLTALDRYHTPALSNAMADGHIDAVQACYTCLEELLADPSLAYTIRPALLPALPELLTGKQANGDSGLGFAVAHGKEAVIAAFHAILVKLLSDPSIAPYLKPALPHMLAAKLHRGASPLSEAMGHRDTTALRLFHAMLKDPAIMPHIRQAMPDFLNAMDSYGKTGVSNALEQGNAAALEAYHDLLAYLLRDPTVAPSIGRGLPQLLNARNRDGTSGYAYAMEHGYTDAAMAYHAMMNDPIIRSYLDDDFSRLLSAETLRRTPTIMVSEYPGPELSGVG